MYSTHTYLNTLKEYRRSTFLFSIDFFFQNSHTDQIQIHDLLESAVALSI